MSKRILIVDDEPNVRLSYRTALEGEGYLVDEARSAATGLEKLIAGHFDLAILDLRMPEMDGLELLAKMRERGLATPTVMVTAYGDLPHAVKAVKLGAIDFLQKPLKPDELRGIVAEVVTRHDETELNDVEARDYAYHLRSAKRALNLRDFEAAKRSLKNALHLDDRSAEGFNLAGVVAELSGDFRIAARYYNRLCGSTRTSPPRSKMRSESASSLNGERATNLSRSGNLGRGTDSAGLQEQFQNTNTTRHHAYNYHPIAYAARRSLRTCHCRHVIERSCARAGRPQSDSQAKSEKEG